MEPIPEPKRRCSTPWVNDARLERELVRTWAAAVRNNAAALRETASLNRWHAQQECAYCRYLRDQAAGEIAARKAAPPPAAGTGVPLTA